MLRRLKTGFKRTWRRPWVWRTIGAWSRPPGVAVLTYHRVTPDGPFDGASSELFEAQIAWLRESCRPIAAADLPGALANARRARPAVLVTFDDGYRDFHDVALPILKRYEVPALVFLPTAVIGTDRMLWTDRIVWLLANDSRERISVAGLDLPLTDRAARLRAADRIKSELKSRPDSERRDIIEQMESECAAGAAPERQMMSWDEVRACGAVATFGGHSHTHPILSRVDAAGQEAEIRACRDVIEAELGYRPQYFAYPNGRRADFDDRTRRALGAAGFRAAFTTEPGWFDGADWLAVPRVPTGGASLSDFAWLITRPPAAG